MMQLWYGEIKYPELWDGQGNNDLPNMYSGTYHEQCFLMVSDGFFTSSSAEFKPYMFILSALNIPALNQNPMKLQLKHDG